MPKAKPHLEIEQMTIGPVTWNMAPYSLIHYSRDYHRAAASCAVIPEARFKPARTYLACHSIELALKAFLCLRGKKLIELAYGPYGHNIEYLLQVAEENDFDLMVTLSESQKLEIKKASIYYNEKVLEYPSVVEVVNGYPHAPDSDILIAIAGDLVAALFGPCQDHA